MKRLIVNADDLGADEARNVGIFEAIREGRVTSASLFPNGPAFEDALHRIRSLGRTTVSFGVHINLSEGKPVSPDLRLLTGPDGSFPGKTSTHSLLMRLEIKRSRERSSGRCRLRSRFCWIPEFRFTIWTDTTTSISFPLPSLQPFESRRNTRFPGCEYPRNLLPDTRPIHSQGG